MSVFSPRQAGISPPLQMLLLLSLVLLCAGIFAWIGVQLAGLIYPIPDLTEFASSVASQAEYPEAMLLVQAVSAVGAFIVPAILFSRILGHSPFQFYRLTFPVKHVLIVLSVLILFLIQPLIMAAGLLNQQLPVPEYLGPIQDWLEDANRQVQQGYDALLNINSIPRLLSMLLVVAIIPAIGEELIFRGGFQRVIHRWSGNGHAAVWIGALIFSMFHFQVYFILPRMLLGAAIGYLYLWSGNLWYAIIAHFFNNAWVVVIAYFYLQQGHNVEELRNTSSLAPGLVIASAVIVVVALLGYRHLALRYKTTSDGG